MDPVPNMFRRSDPGTNHGLTARACKPYVPCPRLDPTVPHSIVHQIGGRVAVSTTVTTTWESVRTLPRRGSGLLLRSDAATPLDTGAPSGRRPRDRGGNGITDESIDKSGVVLIASESEGATTTTTKIERNASSGKCHRRIASTRVGAVKSARVGGSTLRAGGTDIVSPGRSREKPTDDGLENAFAVTTATTTPPEADNSGGPDEATTTAKSSLETVPGVGRGYMVATAAASSAKAEADTEHTGAVSKNASMSCREEKAIVKDDSDYDGEVSASARPVRRRLAVGGAAMAGEGRDPTKKTAATKIGERLGQLPLSKLKIVIGGSPARRPWCTVCACVFCFVSVGSCAWFESEIPLGYYCDLS